MAIIVKNQIKLKAKPKEYIDIPEKIRRGAEPFLIYENIVIATDMDIDGSHIAGILLAFFSKYAPRYVEENKIYMLITPLVTVKNKKGEYLFLFNMDEYQTFREDRDPDGNKYLYDYKKGLGSMEEEEWSSLFQKHSLDDLLKPLNTFNSDNREEEMDILMNWLNEDTEYRKTQIINKINNFDINKV